MNLLVRRANGNESIGNDTRGETMNVKTGVLLALAWAMAVGTMILAGRASHVLQTLAISPPTFSSFVIWTGFILQFLATLTVLTNWKQAIATSVAFMLGYWVCALAFIAGTFWFIGHTFQG
jgi:hypothetical protein